ncbi:MAG: hypothetical protein HFI03_13895 [Lachnospiraceae bacterium]|nr:hypothetical protein [Lachnospiraceae bacterium]
MRIWENIYVMIVFITIWTKREQMKGIFFIAFAQRGIQKYTKNVVAMSAYTQEKDNL